MSDETEAEALRRVLEQWKADTSSALKERVRIKERKKRDDRPPDPSK